MAVTDGVEDFEPGHADQVTVLNVNSDGSRVLTGSIDHRIKIWTREQSTGGRTLIETISAHGADIRDASCYDTQAFTAKWFPVSSGQHFASIGNDLFLRVWSEDPSQPPESGRRFRRVWEIQSSTRVPFTSIDVKIINNVWLYLAVIDHEGLLTIFEPSSADNFKDWRDVDQFHVQHPVPSRGEETAFKVRFDQNMNPSPWYSGLTDDRDMLSLVVTSLKDVKFYSTAPEGKGSRQARSLMFYESGRLPTHSSIVRDVQWAKFGIRGIDWVATASKDGSVRIFEMEAVPALPGQANTNGHYSQNQQYRAQTHSSLTTALVGRRTGAQEQTRDVQTSSIVSTRLNYPFPFRYSIQHATTHDNVHNDAWTLAWNPNGQSLVSSGADGTLKFWIKSTLEGKWMLFSEQAIGLEEGVGIGAEREDPI